MQATVAGVDLPEEYQALLVHQAAVLTAVVSRMHTSAATMRQRQAPAEQLQALMADAEQVQTVTVAIPDPDRYDGLAGKYGYPMAAISTRS